MNIHNCKMLEEITQEFASIVEKFWYKYSNNANITKYSKIDIYKSTCLEITSLQWYHLSIILVHLLTICLIAVVHSFRYSVSYNRDTPNQLGLPWRSYSYQYLNTETSTWGNRGYTPKTPNISYSRISYIRLVVIL